MTVRLITWAWDQDTPDSHARVLLLRLADAADDAGVCWPSHATLASDCRMSERTVMRKLDELIALGVVAKAARVRPGGGSTSNVYQLLAAPAFLRPVGGDTQSPPRVTHSHPRGDTPVTPGVTLQSPHESLIEPSGNLGADARAQESARAAPELAAILAALEARHGRDRALGWLSRCGVEAGVLRARTGVAQRWLQQALPMREWEALGISAIEAA